MVLYFLPTFTRPANRGFPASLLGRQLLFRSDAYQSRLRSVQASAARLEGVDQSLAFGDLTVPDPSYSYSTLLPEHRESVHPKLVAL